MIGPALVFFIQAFLILTAIGIIIWFARWVFIGIVDLLLALGEWVARKVREWTISKRQERQKKLNNERSRDEK